LKSKLKRCLLVAAGCIAIAVPIIAQTVPTSKPAVDPNKVVLTVGDQKMTAKDFDDFVSDLPPQYQQMAQAPAAKRRLADELVNYMLMAGEAKKRGLDQSPKFQRQMKIAKDQILAATLAADLQSHMDESAVKKYFEDHKTEYENVKARHILIRSAGSPIPLDKDKKELTDEQAKAKAEEIRTRITKGEEFGPLAKAESDDKASGMQGGELGNFGHGQMVKPFEEAAFSLKPGDLSQPIKTPFGYHIIQVQEKNTPTYAQMKDEISAKLGPDNMDKMLSQLKKDQKPVIDESYFGPPPSTQPAAAMPPGLGQ